MYLLYHLLGKIAIGNITKFQNENLCIMLIDKNPLAAKVRERLKIKLGQTTEVVHPKKEVNPQNLRLGLQSVLRHLPHSTKWYLLL